MKFTKLLVNIKLLKKILPPYKLPQEASSAIIKNDKNQYLLLKRSVTSKTYQLFWQLPEGVIKKNEDPKSALIRELKEELGVNYDSNDLKFVRKQRVYAKLLGIKLIAIDRYLFRAKSPIKIILSKEHQEYGFFDKNGIKKIYNKLPGLIDLIEKSNI